MAVTSSVLETVADYVTASRVLLQDTVEPFRYTDVDLRLGLDLAFTEIYRIRPDILLDARYDVGTRLRDDKPASHKLEIPSFLAAQPSDTVPVPPGYRVALLYYIVGHAQLRDDEVTADGRATVFLNKFVAQLQTTKA